MIYNTSFVLVSVDISYEDDISTTHGRIDTIIIMSFDQFRRAVGWFNYTKLLLRVARFHGGLIDSWMANRHEHYQSNTRLITHDARVRRPITQWNFIGGNTTCPALPRTSPKLFTKKEFPEFHPNSVPFPFVQGSAGFSGGRLLLPPGKKADGRIDV